ncbi:hypothetical protein BBJ28_00016466 [Nothophytophthora sp. Chile5]|nr:hypothetical protein BBJ28_00016466 [Nothophytophthora sp. Chile5]
MMVQTTSVMERCLNSYYRLRFRLGLVQVYKEINVARREHGLDAIDSKHQMHGHALVLVNSVFGLDEARPMAPHYLMVGLLQSRQLEIERMEPKTSATAVPDRLPTALASWLMAPEGLNKPLIFISFQADVPLSPEFVSTIMDALETVDARLLWKITLQEQAAFDLRSRPRESVLFLGEEVEDATVLASSEMALLITAGDFQSLQEALVAGVPILGIPYSAEQLEGVNAVVRAGAGIELNARSFSEGNVRLAVDTLLHTEHKRFQAEAKHLGELVKTGGGVERAADELLAVAEFGAFHLLPMRNLQPLYKTYLVDVYLIYGAILCGAAIILRTFVSLVLSIFQPLAPGDGVLDGGAHVEVEHKASQ